MNNLIYLSQLLRFESARLIGLFEEIDRQIEKHPQQIISTGLVVKAMILNGLGFLSAPLCLFGEFFIGKATEHLLRQGIKPEHLNDDRIARGLDSLWNQGLTPLFTSIAMLDVSFRLRAYISTQVVLALREAMK